MKLNPKILPLIPPIITGSIALLVLYLVYRWFVKDTENETYNQDINKNKLSYSESQYLIFADAIQEATQGFGTDEDQIYNVFGQLKNNEDLLQLIVAFGKRTYGGISGVFIQSTLPEVLNLELSNSELEELNNILSGNGITLTI